MHRGCIADAARSSDSIYSEPIWEASIEVDTNTKIGGVPPTRDDDPDLCDGGNILASKGTETLPPTPTSPCGGNPLCWRWCQFSGLQY
eukprot:9441233-Pyramimonas_sp.AAC.1